MTETKFTLDGESVRIHVDLTGQGVHAREEMIGGESLWGIRQPDGTVLINNLPLFADDFTFRSLIRVRPRTFVYDGKEYTYENEYDGVVDEGPYETYFAQVVNRDNFYDALEAAFSYTSNDGLPEIATENIGGGAVTICIRRDMEDKMEEILDHLAQTGDIIITMSEDD